MSSGQISINGVLSAPVDAKLSVLDGAFLWGDSVFETLRVYGGRPFALNLHLERLVASARTTRLVLPNSIERIGTELMRTIEVAALPEAYARIVITRGQSDTQSSVVIMVLPLPELPQDLYERGLAACTVTIRRSGPLAACKTGNFLPARMALAEAKEQGADEALLLDAQGCVAEASSANLFARLSGVWATPPLNGSILPGITRQTLIELLMFRGERCTEIPMTLAELLNVDAAFVCSSIREIVAIVRVNGAAIGSGRVPDVVRELHAAYRARVRKI